MSDTNDFLLLANATISISGSLQGLPATRAQDLASRFLTNVAYNAYTLHRIFHPQPEPALASLGPGAIVHDLSGAHGIVRTMFETHVNLHHTLIAPVTYEEREFRMDLWERHALCERLALAVAIGSQDPARKGLEQQVNAETKKIESSPRFLALDKRYRKKILRDGEWRTSSVREMAEASGIHPTFSNYVYKYLSGYSHAEAMSQEIIGAAATQESIRQLQNTPAMFACMTMASVLKNVATFFPKVTDVIGSDPDLSDAVAMHSELWKQDLSRVDPVEAPPTSGA